MPTERRAGFTLIEIMVAVAIVAILAGAITPLVFRELMAARAEATERELAALEDALLDFYTDTGRLPTEAQGLAALVNDPGVTGWNGPYVGGGAGDPIAEISNDGFGTAYVYDLNPITNPAGVADLVVASGGDNHTFEAGSLGGLWQLGGGTDDHLLVLSVGALNRGNERDATRELEELAAAARSYFAANAVFPAALTDLVGDYLDGGFGGGALTDPWQGNYLRILQAGPPSVLLLRSLGPDRQDDGGGDDDLELAVSSVPPGRETTLFKLEIAQAALNNNPALVLGGPWTGVGGVRAALGLTAAFVLDGWGRSFGVNVASRVIFSAGPDGNAGLVADNIPTGVGP